MKVVPQAGNCKEIEVGGRIYRRGRGGLFDMPEAAARLTVAQEGGQWPALSGITRCGQGFKCRSCGFGTWFRKCSRCGGIGEREV